MNRQECSNDLHRWFGLRVRLIFNRCGMMDVSFDIKCRLLYWFLHNIIHSNCSQNTWNNKVSFSPACNLPNENLGEAFQRRSCFIFKCLTNFPGLAIWQFLIVLHHSQAPVEIRFICSSWVIMNSHGASRVFAIHQEYPCCAVYFLARYSNLVFISRLRPCRRPLWQSRVSWLLRCWFW